jgi:hypothetical protein
MALTRGFKENVKARVQRDPAFRRELLREGVETILNGDAETGKNVLRNYINATIGLGDLAQVTNRSPKSLMRMLGPKGNPQAQKRPAPACLIRALPIYFAKAHRNPTLGPKSGQ